MKKKTFRLCVAVFLILIVALPAFAAVDSVCEIDEESDCVYIAGNPNYYPVEYYNPQTKRFEGILPEILNDISSKSGVEFLYLYNEKTTQPKLARSGMVEIVSSYMTDTDEEYAADEVTVFSYMSDGKLAKVGFAFTESADKKLIEMIKSESENLSEHEISGYLISASKSKSYGNDSLMYIISAGCFMLVLIIIAVVVALSKLRSKFNRMKTTDIETGLANISSLEDYLNRMVSDFSKKHYYISYFIVDSNYLQVYHSKTNFVDAIKYSASVLKTYEKENEITARISENGFAFVFQSESDDEATNRIRSIADIMNNYIHSEDAKSGSLFHVVVYNLGNSDTSCELLLFNLRKNCSKLVGTDKQIVMVDDKMMNKDAEEKQLLESIMRGFENKEFKLYLQYIVDTKNHRIVSAEALSRWIDANQEIIMPGKYIGVLESSGMITRLDYYMFEMVCCQLHKWRDTEFDALTLSCNFTRITISEENFVEKIKEISDRYVFEKRKLIIEITEDAIEKNREIAMNNISECKKNGIQNCT